MVPPRNYVVPYLSSLLPDRPKSGKSLAPVAAVRSDVFGRLVNKMWQRRASWPPHCRAQIEAERGFTAAPAVALRQTALTMIKKALLLRSF
jgi:hypothetical protein